MSHIHIFVLDNDDSFIFNLVDFLHTLSDNISIYRQSADPKFILEKMQDSRQAGNKPILLLSPGPKSPSDIPNMMQLLDITKGIFPILGICLGHQAIIEHYGGVVGTCQNIMHGKTSVAHLQNHPVFDSMGEELIVARYHSLTGLSIPENLSVIAESDDAIMGVIHETHKIIGYQFHPESILTIHGEKLLKNTLHYLTGA